MKLHSLLGFVAIPIPPALHPLPKRGPHLLVAPLICHITPVGPTSATMSRVKATAQARRISVPLLVGTPSVRTHAPGHRDSFRPPAPTNRVSEAPLTMSQGSGPLRRPVGSYLRATPEGIEPAPRMIAHQRPTAPTTRVKWSSTHSPARSRSLSHRRHTPFPSVDHIFWWPR